MTVRTFLHASANFGGIFAMIVAMTGAVIFTPDSVNASAESDKKFSRDLESIFGATLKTKHGAMSLRQRKDLNGRIRKQIITGPGFSEIQLDQDGDGTVDFL